MIDDAATVLCNVNVILSVTHFIADIGHGQIEVFRSILIEGHSFHFIPFITGSKGGCSLAGFKESDSIVRCRTNGTVSVQVLVQTPFCPIRDVFIGNVRILAGYEVLRGDSVVFIDPSLNLGI